MQSIPHMYLGHVIFHLPICVKECSSPLNMSTAKRVREYMVSMNGK